MDKHSNKSYFDLIIDHYKLSWQNECKLYLWDKGPLQSLPYNFRVLEFGPNTLRNMWTYATCCMSTESDPNPIELHIFSPERDEGIIEILTAIAYYHHNTNKISLNHTVNFGKPWRGQSICDYGLISLPYLDGPNLENLELKNKTVKFYWLVPVTKAEVEYKKKLGIEALEQKFDSLGLDYLNPLRKSLV